MPDICSVVNTPIKTPAPAALRCSRDFDCVLELLSGWSSGSLKLVSSGDPGNG